MPSGLQINQQWFNWSRQGSAGQLWFMLRISWVGLAPMTSWVQVGSMYINSDALVKRAVVTWGMLSWQTTGVQKRQGRHTSTFKASVQITVTNTPWPNQVMWPSPWSTGQGTLLYPQGQEEESDYLLSKNANYQSIFLIYCKTLVSYEHAASTQVGNKLLRKGQDCILYVTWALQHLSLWLKENCIQIAICLCCSHCIFLIDYFVEQF